MQIATFIIPIKQSAEALEETNRFLRAHSILCTDRRFVENGENSLANMPAIMGSEKFIKGVKNKFSKKKKDTEVPESKKYVRRRGISKRRYAGIMKSGRRRWIGGL